MVVFNKDICLHRWRREVVVMVWLKVNWIGWVADASCRFSLGVGGYLRWAVVTGTRYWKFAGYLPSSIYMILNPSPSSWELAHGSEFSEAFWVWVFLSWRKEWHLSTHLFRGRHTANRWRLNLSLLTALQKENLFKDHPLSLPRWWLTVQQARHTDNCTVV